MERNRAVNAAIIFLGLVAFFIVLKTFKVFLMPFTFAVLITFLLIPLMNYSKKIKIPFWLTLTIIFIVLGGLMTLFGALLVSEINTFNENLPRYETQIESTISFTAAQMRALYPGEMDVKGLVNAQLLSKVASRSVQVTSSLFTNIFLIIVFVIFLIPFHKNIMYNIWTQFGKGGMQRAQQLMVKTEASIRQYLYTKTVISFGTGIVSAIFLALFGSDFVLLLTLLIFFFNFIPNIGSVIAVGAALILYVLKFGMCWQLIVLAILLIGVQILFGNFLEPKFTGAKLSISPAIIILSLFFWFWVWGIAGMMLAVPLTSIIKILMENNKNTKRVAALLS